jgi:hypothetical protein
MNQTDDKIDQLLKSHLAGELNPHVGKAAKAFAAALHRPAPHRISRYWAAAAVLFITASVVGVVIVRQVLQKPVTITDTNSLNVPDPIPLMPVAQSLDWQILDDGTVMLAGDVPVRRLRRQVVERIKWYDPDRQTTVWLSVPQEQVMFIGHRSPVSGGS